MKITLFIALCLILSHFSFAQGNVGDVTWEINYDCSNLDSVIVTVEATIILNGFALDSLSCQGFTLTECSALYESLISFSLEGELLMQPTNSDVEIFYEINGIQYSEVYTASIIIPLEYSSVIQHDCTASNSGQIDIIVTDPEMDYSVWWVPFNVFDDSFEGLSPSTYSAIIEDFNCNSETFVSFTVFGALSIDNIIVSYDCYDDIGLLTPNISGNGSGDYTYSWTGPNGFVSNDVQPLITSSGSYSLNIIDNHSGCVDIATVNVDANEGTVAPDGNCDCLVNSADLLMFLSAFGSSANDPGFDWFWDLNSDGIVNSSDMLLLLGDNGSNVCD